MENYFSPQMEDCGYKNYKELYLDWINNFLTIQGFANYHNLDYKYAKEMVDNALWLYKN